MKLNPDKGYVRDMREAIAKNSGFCPCIVKKSMDSRCPCKDFREKKSVIATYMFLNIWT